jgi:tRNA dimethylallyltransferase
VNSSGKSIIIIGGPTASGKTSIAIEVAKHFNTEIISADSRQCFKELNIGVARPSEEELRQVPHHFIASHSIKDKVTASVFEEYALSTAEALFKQHDVVVMVGGTGLYIKAFCEGLDEIPVVPEIIRSEVIQLYNTQGISYLQQQVKELDPEFYSKGEIKNPQRLMRALEIFKATGRSILSFRTGEKVNRTFAIVKYVLQVKKEQLHENINHRVDHMMQNGLLDEVKSLVPYQHLNALQTVGYRELFEYLDGEVDLPTAVNNIKTNTRKYAKRQVTWFKKDPAFLAITPSAKEIIESI